MAKDRMDVPELQCKRGMDGDGDFLKEALRVADGILNAEVSAQIGAAYDQRRPDRVTHRSGYRTRSWDTRVGSMDLHILKIREGSYFPTLLGPRRSERALLAVIQRPTSKQFPPGGWTTPYQVRGWLWSNLWAATAYPRAMCPVSTRNRTRWCSASSAGHWRDTPASTCDWTP